MQMSPVTTTFTKPKASGSHSHQQNRPMNTGNLLPGQVKALRGAQEWQESQMIAQPFGDYHWASASIKAESRQNSCRKGKEEGGWCRNTSNSLLMWRIQIDLAYLKFSEAVYFMARARHKPWQSPLFPLWLLSLPLSFEKSFFKSIQPYKILSWSARKHGMQPHIRVSKFCWLLLPPLAAAKAESKIIELP